MNLEKRLKRHIIGPRQDFFAVTHPGFEALCRRELLGLSDSLEIVDETKGGVSFRGKMADLYQANLYLRIAGRVLMRLARFPATNFRQLEKKAGEVPWELYLPPGAVPVCSASCHGSRLYHSKAVTLRLESLIEDHWRRLGIRIQGPSGQTLFIRIEKDQVTLSLDSSGTNLYQRGLKTHHSRAPLRETLAAGILMLGGYDPRRPLVDPMCGSGTFALEAALMAKRIPAGSYRNFAFMQWPSFKEKQWRYFIAEGAKAHVRYDAPLIMAADKDERACRQLAACAASNHLDDVVAVQCRDFFEPQTGQGILPPGLVVLNPPYGRRLNPAEPVTAFYAAIGRQLQKRYAGWNLALVAPHSDLAGLLPFKVKTTPLVHGGLRLTVLTGQISG